MIVDALRKKYEYEILSARANIDVYLRNPAGIGEHPDVLAAIQDQLDVIAHEEERIQVIEKHFSSHTHSE